MRPLVGDGVRWELLRGLWGCRDESFFDVDSGAGVGLALFDCAGVDGAVGVDGVDECEVGWGFAGGAGGGGADGGEGGELSGGVGAVSFSGVCAEFVVGGGVDGFGVGVVVSGGGVWVCEDQV